MIDSCERVVLVDAGDCARGTADKLEAHRLGLRHRALSVVIRDRSGRLLLQKRARSKYHSGGLWTNTCCSHPRPGESAAGAAARRLREEMGFACALLPLMRVEYRAEVGNGLTENEVVHVFAGLYEGPIRPDPAEAEGYAWVDPNELQAGLAASPGQYSVWFRKYVAEHWLALTTDPIWLALRGEPAEIGRSVAGTRI